MSLLDAHGQRTVALAAEEAWARLLRALADQRFGAAIESVDEANRRVEARTRRTLWSAPSHLLASIDHIDGAHSLVRLDAHQRWFNFSIAGVARQRSLITRLLDAIERGDEPVPVARPGAPGRPRWPWALIGAGALCGAVALGLWLADRPVQPRRALDPGRAYPLAHASLPAITDLPGPGWSLWRVDDFEDDQPLPSRSCTELEPRSQRVRQAFAAAAAGRAAIGFAQEHPALETPQIQVRVYVLRDLSSAAPAIALVREEHAERVAEGCLRERLIDAGFTDVSSSARIPVARVPAGGVAVAYRFEGALEGTAHTLAYEDYVWSTDNVLVRMRISGAPQQVGGLPEAIIASTVAAVGRAAQIKDAAPAPAVAAWGRTFCGYVDRSHAPTAPDVSKMTAAQARAAYVDYFRAQADRHGVLLAQLVALTPPPGAERFQEGYISAIASTRIAYEGGLYEGGGARRAADVQNAVRGVERDLQGLQRSMVAAFREAPPVVAGVAQCTEGPAETAAWGAGVCTAAFSLAALTTEDMRTSALLDAGAKSLAALKRWEEQLRREQSLLAARTAPASGAALHEAIRNALAQSIQNAGKAAADITKATRDQDVAASLTTLGTSIATAYGPVSRALDGAAPDVKRAVSLCS